MFIEPNLKGERRGWIEVICGSMFSGKTEELIRRLKRVKIANLKVEIFKPAIDTRYDEQKIVSHDTNAIHSTPVDSSQNILLLAQDVDVVGIDEAGHQEPVFQASHRHTGIARQKVGCRSDRGDAPVERQQQQAQRQHRAILTRSSCSSMPILSSSWSWPG